MALSRELAYVAAAVLHDVDFVARRGAPRIVGRVTQVSVHRPDRTIFFRPLFWTAATKFRSSHEFMVKVLSMGVCFGKMSQNLGPHVAAEALGFHRAEDHRHVEHPGGLGEGNVVVDDRLTVEARHAEEHLRLEIDQRDDAVVWGQQSLLTAASLEPFLLP